MKCILFKLYLLMVRNTATTQVLGSQWHVLLQLMNLAEVGCDALLLV